MNSMRCATLPTYLLRYSVYDYSSSNEANDMLRLVLFSLLVLGLEARVMKNTAIRSTRNIDQCDTSCSGWVENALAGKRAYRPTRQSPRISKLHGWNQGFGHDGVSTHGPRRIRNLASTFGVLGGAA